MGKIKDMCIELRNQGLYYQPSSIEEVSNKPAESKHDFWKPEIEIPTDWSRQADRDYFVGIVHEPLDDYWTSALEFLGQKRDFVGEELEKAIRFFSNGSKELDLTSPFARLNRLRQLIRSNTCNAEARERIEMDCDRCGTMLRMYNALLERTTSGGRSVWLREIVDTADWIHTAGYLLNETIRCEFVDTTGDNRESVAA